MSENTQQINQTYDWVSKTPTPLNDGSGFWNFGYWSRSTSDRRQACENLLERLMAMIPEKAGNLLEVACGTGETTRYLFNHYKPDQITAIDINETQIALCQQRDPDCAFRVMSATEMDFPDESFDNVISVEAAFHFNTREKFLNEAFRVLKPGGRLVMSDMILAARASVQPPENVLPGLREYKWLCYQAGFEDVMVFDASRECCGGFGAYGAAFLDEQLRNGRINQAFYRSQLGWISRASLRPYCLVSCQKL